MSEIEYIPCKSMVIDTNNEAWFGSKYNMNIYRGCSHGCIYCDSRSECYGDENFGKVKVKENALLVIEKDLKSKKRKGVVATGSMSDPYNPLEEELQLTRKALGLLDKYGFGVAIATKSNLVTRDIDMLNRISAHSPVIVKMTITTADDDLAGRLEPEAPASSARFSALQQLSNQGVFCGILLMPLLPFINDTIENIDALVAEAVKSKVRYIYPAFGVTLRDRQRNYFYDRLDELYPNLKEEYKRIFGNSYSCSSTQAKLLFQHLVIACEENGILYKMPDITAAYQQNYGVEQLSMFLG